MVVVETLDFAHAALSKVNSDGVSDGRIFATSILAGVFTPSFLSLFSAQEKHQIFVYYPIAFATAFAYTHLRRRKIGAVRDTLPSPVPMRVRLIMAMFLIVSTGGSALVGRHSSLLAVTVLLAVACLPWQSWALQQRAP